MAVIINMIAINVNSQNTNSAVAIGENQQAAWTSHNKSNFGNGVFVGNTLAPNNIIIILDNDIIDMPVNDNDFVPSGQNQQA